MQDLEIRKAVLEVEIELLFLRKKGGGGLEEGIGEGDGGRCVRGMVSGIFDGRLGIEAEGGGGWRKKGGTGERREKEGC